MKIAKVQKKKHGKNVAQNGNGYLNGKRFKIHSTMSRSYNTLNAIMLTR